MSSSSRSAAGYHHGDLARALEDAALELLECMPAAEISLREVARAANVSHNAPYHHFADRLGLLKVLAERSMASLLARIRDAEVGADTPQDVLLQGGIAYIRFAVEHPHAFDAIYDPTVCVPGSPTATMAPLIADLEGVLTDAAADVGLDGPGDVPALWGLMHGLGTLAAAGHLDVADAETSYAWTIRGVIAGR